MGITLLCLTPVFKNMPVNAQGAIIVSAIIGLFNYSEWIFLWKVRCPCSFRHDFHKSNPQHKQLCWANLHERAFSGMSSPMC